jgi:hypothetical protein
MAVYDNLKAIRRLTNSSLTSIIDITNLNFRSLSDANLEFLNNIKYDEVTNSFTIYDGTFDFVHITDTISLELDGIPTFTIDSLGRAEGQELLVKVAETKRLRLTDFPDWPTAGVPGEIIYTGIQNQQPQFGEDFIGYLQGRGWVSLTDTGITGGYITLSELAGSPPVPPCPLPNNGIIWVGPPGYDTAEIPTTQTLYYTDENCQVYDLTSGSGGMGNKKFIKSTETIEIKEDHQYWIYGNLTIEGVVNNYGEVVIANGTIVLQGSGQINNLGTGLIKFVNLATGDSMQVAVRTFNSAASTPLNLVHGLGTKDFVFSAREGDTLLDIDLSHIDTDTVQIITVGAVSNGTIVFQAKI